MSGLMSVADWIDAAIKSAPGSDWLQATGGRT